MAQSVESRALRRSNLVFKKGVDPDNLVTLLYSNELLTPEEKSKARQKMLTDGEKLEEVFSFLERRVSTDAGVFHELLKVLQEEPALKGVADQMQGTYDELKSKAENQVAASTQDSTTVSTGQSSERATVVPGNVIHLPRFRQRLKCSPYYWVLVIGAFLILIVSLLLSWIDCYQLGLCYSKSLPRIDHFVGREEDITRYLDFDHSNIQVVHIVGPPGFGKSTLAKKMGHIFLRKRVKVHYVDIRAVTDMDGFAERVLYSVIESSNKKITLKRLKRWAHEQYSQTLLIIDNCDEILETHRGDFIEYINEMIASPRKRIKYILTSQKWVADVGTYQIHSIYNLSSEAAGQLLSKVAPDLTEGQKRQISELTGNVPLALDVVGAIFKFPNAPTAEEVIKRLKENPVATLSPSELHSKVDVSIGLAYSYLPLQLKELCVNLSHFPASFDQNSAVFIFDLNSYDEVSLLDLLVQRSLLQFNRPTKRYHFHQLIRSYFLQIQGQNKELAESYFNSEFQLYFAKVLYRILDEDKSALSMLDVEKQNLQYMFSLFTTAKHVNYTYFAVRVTLIAIDGVLKQRFHPIELCDNSQRMIKAMESYTTDEAANQESFHEIYAKVVIKAAKLEKQSHIEVDSAIKILSSRRKKIDDGFERQDIGSNTYVQFYSDLAEYYSEKGEDIKSAWCHAHILEKVHNQKCNYNCKYFDISVAYDNIGDRVQAFHFRELAYEHQLPSLSRMQQARLFLALYNDYSNVSVGNNPSRAANFSTMIIETVYNYLTMASYSEAEYLEEVYFNAVDFFREKHMEDHMIALQYKMEDIVIGQCPLLTCVAHHYSSAIDASKRQCHHLAINLGKTSLKVITGLRARIELYTIIGENYFLIGNYTDAVIWLKGAIELHDILNTDLSYNNSLFYKGLHTDDSFKVLRVRSCLFLIMSGDYYNIFCYGYFIKDSMSFISAAIVKSLHKGYSARSNPWQPPTKPKTISETSVVEAEYSFIWSQFEKKYRKFEAIVEKYTSIVKSTIHLIDQAIRNSKIAFSLHLVFILLMLLLVSFFGILFVIDVMFNCCTKQIGCHFSLSTYVYNNTYGMTLSFILVPYVFDLGLKPVLLLILIFSAPWILFFWCILIIADLMSACCTEQQIRCCFSCATFFIFLCIFSTIVTFVFVLGLDVFY